jgi:hypothetical protein
MTCHICERYVAGESLRALAKRYKLSTTTISEHLKRAGIPVRPRGRPRKVHYTCPRCHAEASLIGQSVANILLVWCARHGAQEVALKV